MSREGYRGPKLPRVLLDQVQSGGVSKNKRDLSRKDKRKAERQAKRQLHRTGPRREAPKRAAAVQNTVNRASSPPEETRSSSAAPARKQPAKDAKPTKSILKKRHASPEPDSEDETDVADDDDSVDDEVEEHERQQDNKAIPDPTVSRANKRKLEEDDAEIAALEKKLGIKGKKSKALQEDGLDWLAGGSDAEDGNGHVQRPEDVDWLRNKRRKASTKTVDVPNEQSGEEELGSESSADIEPGDDDFEGFGSEAEPDEDVVEPPPPQKQRENPYVAAPGPISGISAPPAKYIPPPLRKAATSDEEMMRRLRSQIQGKVNKVSESNLIFILREVEDIYKENARQHVTSKLIDIVIGLMTADVAHPDTVLIIHAAFSAAIYKVVGTDFGAQLLEIIVERFDHFKGRNVGDGKQCLNLLAFLSYLYTFQVVGSGILFDYIRLLLAELTEENTEMLLRIMRTSGQQLRQDDPSALKDIVMLLQKLVAQTGEDNLSVRTKFMIETITNLKNNRVKTGLAASAIVAEQTTRMKKTLGTLNSRAKATEPLRITLADINDTEKKGKWWLVGASYHDPAKLATSTSSTIATATHEDSDTGYESSTPGSVNLHRLAKKSGMNTDVRRAIFISLLSAADYKDAYARMGKLRLRNKQQLEIPRVMVSCVGGEEAYNPFYALVAKRVCGEGKREVRKAFLFTLWNFWRETESGVEGEDDEDEQGGENVSVRKVVNLAKFYASLVADGSLSLALLKKLDFNFFPAKEKMWVEVFLTSIFFQLRREAQKEAKESGDPDEVFEAKVRKVFAVGGASGMLSGLRHFLRQTIESSDLARTKKEKKALREGCSIADETLARAEEMGGVGMEMEEESEGNSEG